MLLPANSKLVTSAKEHMKLRVSNFALLICPIMCGTAEDVSRSDDQAHLSSFSCQPLWVGHALKPCPLL